MDEIEIFVVEVSSKYESREHYFDTLEEAETYAELQREWGYSTLVY